MTLRKSSWKRLGLLALMVAVMFTFAACDSDNGDDSVPSVSQYDVTFEVNDADGEAIEGAVVSMDDEEETTDAQGLANFTDVDEDEDGYEYTVSADGYADGSGTVIVESEVKETVELEVAETGDLTLSTNLDEGTEVTLKRGDLVAQAVNEFTAEVADDGTVTFTDVPVGFNYTASSDGKADVTVDFTEDGQEEEANFNDDTVLEVTEVNAINVDSVTVEVTELEEDLEAVTVEVVDPDGNTVAVEEEDLLSGTTEVTFQFEETLDEVAEGVWTVDGVEFDKKEANAIVAVNEADSTITMYDALIEDYGEYFTNVNEDYMQAYVDEFGTDYETIEAIQEDIEAVNEVQDNMDYVTAINEANTALELRTALRDADDAGLIERYNEDYLEDDTLDDYVTAHANIDDANNDANFADFEDVQDNLIDAVNNDNAVAALDAAFADLDQDLVDDANAALDWVEAETELGTVNHVDGTTPSKEVEVFATDLDNHELFIDVVEADTDLRLKNALQALTDAATDLGDEHLNNVDASEVDMDGIYDVLLEDYRTEIASTSLNLKVLGDNNDPAEDGIAGVIATVNADNPMFDSAVTNDSQTIEVTMTEEVNSDITISEADLVVTADGEELVLSGDSTISGSGTATDTFTVALDNTENEIEQGQEVKITYTGDTALLPFENKEVTNEVNDMGDLSNTEAAIEFTPAEIGATEPVDVTLTLKDGSNNTVTTENGEYDVRIRVKDSSNDETITSTTRTATFNNGVITETINDIETAGDLYVEVTVFDMIVEGTPVVFDSSNETNTFTVTAQDAVEFDMALGVDSVINTEAGSNNTIDFSYIKAVDEYGNVDTEYSGAPESKDVLLEVIRDGEVLAIQAVTSSTGVVTLPFSDGEFVVEQIEVDESIVSIFQAGDIVRITDENANISGEIEITEAMITTP